MAINPQLTNFTLAADAINGRKFAPEKQGEDQKCFVTLEKSLIRQQVNHQSLRV